MLGITSLVVLNVQSRLSLKYHVYSKSGAAGEKNAEFRFLPLELFALLQVKYNSGVLVANDQF